MKTLKRMLCVLLTVWILLLTGGCSAQEETASGVSETAPSAETAPKSVETQEAEAAASSPGAPSDPSKGRAESGETVFYDIYTDAEKQADPAKADTGLFFFQGKPGEKFAVCNAGGGFAYVGAMHDSFPHAMELSKLTQPKGGRKRLSQSPKM